MIFFAWLLFKYFWCCVNLLLPYYTIIYRFIHSHNYSLPYTLFRWIPVCKGTSNIVGLNRVLVKLRWFCETPVELNKFISHLCVCAQSLIRVQFFVTPWSVACQAFRQEQCNGLPFPIWGFLSYPRIEPLSAALSGGFFTIAPPGNPLLITYNVLNTMLFDGNWEDEYYLWASWGLVRHTADSSTWYKGITHQSHSEL